MGTEGEYKTSKSKMKRFKDRVRVGEESREAAGEARSTEKREQRRQIMFCFCTYPETETLRREGRAVPVGLCTGEGVLLWLLNMLCLPREATSRGSEPLHKTASSAYN